MSQIETKQSKKGWYNCVKCNDEVYATRDKICHNCIAKENRRRWREKQRNIKSGRIEA